jgi:site-specific recombinase XerD
LEFRRRTSCDIFSVFYHFTFPSEDHKPRRTDMKTLFDALTEFNWHCRFERNLSTLTCKAYELDLQQFAVRVGGDHALSHIESKDIRLYIQALFDSRHRATTVKRKFASLKAFFRYAESGGLTESNPTNQLLMRIRLPKRLPRAITLTSVQALLVQAKTEVILAEGRSERDTRLTTQRHSLRKWQGLAVLELLFATGMRVSELCGLNVGDIDLTAKTVRVFGKGSKERILFLTHDEVVSSLDRFLALRQSLAPDSESFFLNRCSRRLQPSSVRMILNHLTEKTNLSCKVSPHMIRHTTATLMIENGIDILFVQKILGHSSISTTQWYTHVSSFAERKILQERHPRNLMTVPAA